jgi:hypothetical protein
MQSGAAMARLTPLNMGMAEQICQGETGGGGKAFPCRQGSLAAG